MIIVQLDSEQLRILIQSSVREALKESAIRNTTAPTPPKDELLTVKQTAAFLKLTVPTIYSKVHRRELPFMKKGKRLYFSQKELLAYLQSGRKKTHTEIAAEADAYLSNTQKNVR